MKFKSNYTTTELPGGSSDQFFNFEQLSIVALFQRLWSVLFVFMRTYIHSAIQQSPNASVNAERSMNMSGDFRNAMLVFYGPEIADRFNDLFTTFIARPMNVVEGFSSNNRELIDRSIRNWYSDANALDAFLASINLYWDESQWRNLFNQFIQLMIEIITSMVSGDYRQEVQVCDRIFDLTSMMGSYMARGLIARQSANRNRSQNNATV